MFFYLPVNEYGDDLSIHLLCSPLSLSHTAPPLLWGINQLSDTCTEADREADRGREMGGGGGGDDGGGEEAARDKGGTSQIGNISFQHVLSEHFICEKRRKGDDPHGSKA